jgi:magnesium and cobalt transporter
VSSVIRATPCYDQGPDDIIGVLHVKTLARQQANRASQPFDLRQLARPVAFVPESLALDQMLTRFRRDRRQLAIVVDEYGGTAGLVTSEDVIEEVVGEILDEFDLEIDAVGAADREPDASARRSAGGRAEPTVRSESEAHPEADTVGGLVMASLGRLAEQGDHMTIDGVVLEVEAVEGLAVQTVLVRLPTAGTAHATG